MFSIYMDGEVIHAPNLGDTTRLVADPTLTETLNKPAVLEFTMPPVNVKAADVRGKRSTVTVYDGDECIFVGRPESVKRDLYNNRRIRCEDPISWLRDGYLMPGSVDNRTWNATLQYWQAIINMYNAQVSDNRHMQVGYIYNGQASMVHAREKIMSVWNDIKSISPTDEISFVYPYVRNITYPVVNGAVTPAINYLNPNDHTACPPITQVIRFGRNLISLEDVTDAGNVYTVIVPVDRDGRTVASVNNGKVYIESAEGIAQWGRICRVVEMPYDPDTVYNPVQFLYTQGTVYLNNAIKQANTIKLTAIDLALLGIEEDGIRVGPLARVVSPPNGIDAMYQSVKRVLKLASPERNRYEFGIVSTQLTAKIL